MIPWQEILSTNISELEIYAKESNIHPLALEDCIHRDQRPKFESFDVHQFLVWFMIARGQIYELQFVIFPTKILLVPHEPAPEGGSWAEYFKLSNDHKDVWHFLHQALDRATDITAGEARKMFEQIDDFEEKIFKSGFSPESLLSLKKQLNRLEFSIGHLPFVCKQLEDFYQKKDDLLWKWRDLYDHCERIIIKMSLYRSQISTTIELYWGHQSNRTNTQIKKLSLLASVSVPLTFWSSFWGMNFEVIPFARPELFIVALAIMVVSAMLTIWIIVAKGYWSD